MSLDAVSLLIETPNQIYERKSKEFASVRNKVSKIIGPLVSGLVGSAAGVALLGFEQFAAGSLVLACGLSGGAGFSYLLYPRDYTDPEKARKIVYILNNKSLEDIHDAITKLKLFAIEDLEPNGLIPPVGSSIQISYEDYINTKDPEEKEQQEIVWARFQENHLHGNLPTFEPHEIALARER